MPSKDEMERSLEELIRKYVKTAVDKDLGMLTELEDLHAKKVAWIDSEPDISVPGTEFVGCHTRESLDYVKAHDALEKRIASERDKPVRQWLKLWPNRK